MSISRRFLSSTIYMIIGTGANSLVAFVIFIILARLLDPAAVGLVAFALIFVEISRTIVFSGLPEAIVQRATWEHDVSSTCFTANVLLALAFVLLVGGLLAPILTYYYHPDAGPVLTALSLVILIDSGRVIHEAKLKREFKFKMLAARTSIATLVAGVLGVALAFNGYGIWALVASRLVSSTILTTLTWTAARWRPSLNLDWPILKSFGSFVRHLAPARVSLATGLKMPQFMLGIFAGPAAVGFYNVGAHALDAITQIAINPTRDAALAALSRLPDDAAIGRAYLRLTRVISFLACPIYLGIAVVGPDLVQFVFGPRWELSGWVMSALACSVGGVMFGYFMQPALTATGRTRSVLTASLTGLLAALLFSASAAPFGVIVMALANSLRHHLSAPFWLRLLNLNFGLKWRDIMACILPFWLAAAAMGLCVLALRWSVLVDTPVILRLALCAAFGVVLYPALLWFFARRHLNALLSEVVQFLPGRLRKIIERISDQG